MFAWLFGSHWSMGHVPWVCHVQSLLCLTHLWHLRTSKVMFAGSNTDILIVPACVIRQRNFASGRSARCSDRCPLSVSENRDVTPTLPTLLPALSSSLSLNSSAVLTAPFCFSSVLLPSPARLSFLSATLLYRVKTKSLLAPAESSSFLSFHLLFSDPSLDPLGVSLCSPWPCSANLEWPL